jgi:hypothetical protein
MHAQLSRHSSDQHRLPGCYSPLDLGFRLSP